MDAITTLLSNLSVEGIILIIVLFAVAIKFLGELFEYLYNKVKKYFDIKDAKEERHEEVMNSLHILQKDMKEQKERSEKRQRQVDSIDNKLNQHYQDFEDLKSSIHNQTTEITNLNDRIKTLTERTQDSTRAYLIDKHHHFCYQIKAIDDMSLQDMERRFMYYKAAGGDTFIDNLMEEVRALPRINVENLTGHIGKEC